MKKLLSSLSCIGTLLGLFLLTILVVPHAFTGTTGKIAGTVVDAQTGEPLPGVNVVLVGTTLGAATNLDGYYVILNVPPGVYTLRSSFIGYTPHTVSNVRVNIDLTTTVDMKLKPEILEGEEVTIVAERPVVVKDLAASQAYVEAIEVDVAPITSVSEVISLQAGVLGGTDGPIIRGGSADQTAFVLDGVTLRDERTNLPFTGISLSSVQDIQIQTGGFAAEYSNIRSGIINVVTREGDRLRYSGTVNLRYRPAAPKHFGMSPNDPNSYWLRPFLDPEVAWTGTSAWDLHTQRQYPSFEGWNSVSERLLQDNNPNNDLTPEAAQRLFKWEHRRQVDIQEPDYNIDAGFGGPLPLVGDLLGGMRFFLSYRNEQNAYLIPLSRATYNDNITQLKLTTNIKNNMKLTMSGFYGEIFGVNDNNNGNPGFFYSPGSVASELTQRSFIETIIFATDYFAPTSIYRHMMSAKLTHTISSNTFYEASFERIGNIYSTNPNAMRDTSRVYQFGNNFFVDEAPFGYMPLPSTGINGLRMGVGMSNSRDRSKIFTNTIRFDITSQVNRNNQMKAGVELVINQHDVAYGSIDITLPASRPWSIWNKTPIRGGAYLQDKIEFKGLIANLGLRLDYSSPGGDWIDVDPFDRRYFSSNYSPALEEELEKTMVDAQFFLSPRLGISHPITDRSKLFFNYGHFRQMPEAQRLYNVQRVTEGRVSQIGDPNNILSKTVAYELGFEQELWGQYLLRVAGYYKDATNQPNLVQYISFDGKVNYFKAASNFYEDIRGFEVELKKRFSPWVWGFVNYTYQVSSLGFFDKRRFYENPAEQRDYDRQSAENKGIFSKPLARPFLRSQINIDTPVDFGPKLLGHSLFGDLHASFLTSWRAGQYITWTRGQDPVVIGIRNNVQYPDYFNIDMRLSKDFNIGSYGMRFYIDVNNLLNTKLFSPYGFVDGNDFRDYMDSLLWPEEIGAPLGYRVFGNDKIGDLRPEGVAYDALEPNPNNDPAIAARNNERIAKKSYIDNPNQTWLYYLNPRDIIFGVRIDF